MSDRPDFLTRLKISVRALLPEHWKGQAGQQFRKTVDAVSEFTKEHIKPGERLKEAPDVVWDTIREKSSRTGVNLADEEQKRIASELSRRTLEDKARQEKAIADRLETEARIAKIQEQQARLDLIEKLRKLNIAPVRDERGSINFGKVLADYDWNDLTGMLMPTSDLQLPDVGIETATNRIESKTSESHISATVLKDFIQSARSQMPGADAEANRDEAEADEFPPPAQL